MTIVKATSMSPIELNACPNMPVTSGYADGTLAHKLDATPVEQKPQSRTELSRELRGRQGPKPERMRQPQRPTRFGELMIPQFRPNPERVRTAPDQALRSASWAQMRRTGTLLRKRKSSIASRPEPQKWAASFAQAAVEAMVGVRPLQQLGSWLSAPLYDALMRRYALLSRLYPELVNAPQRPACALREAHIYEKAKGRLEACVTVHHDGRLRCVALELTPHESTWLVTALEIG